MNRIEITTRELMGMLKLPKTSEELYEILDTIYFKGFIFNEFTLVVTDQEMIYKVKINGEGEEQKIILTEINRKGGKVRKQEIEFTLKQYIESLIELVKSSNGSQNLMELYYKLDPQSLGAIALTPMSFMVYIMKESKERKVEYIEKKENKNTKSKNKKQNNEIKSTKTYNLLDVIKIYQKSEEERKKYTYKVDSYERRGGYRHLKNGKVVYYRPTTCHPKEKGGDKITKKYKL